MGSSSAYAGNLSSLAMAIAPRDLADPIDPIDIRPMVAADIPNILNFSLNEGEPQWSQQTLSDALGVGYLAWVACHQDSGGLMAYAVANHVLEHADVQNVVVDKAFRGHGIGRQVLKALLHALAQTGVETVFLEVRCANQVAIKLYQSMGFEQIQKRRGYYPGVDGVREDAWVFSLACR